MRNRRTFFLLTAAMLALIISVYNRHQSKVRPERIQKSVHVEKKEKLEIRDTKDVQPKPKLSQLKVDLQNVMDELPTHHQLKELSEEEVHHTPPIIVQGGKMLGELIDAADKDSIRREDTVQFLVSCAENDELVTTIRALCWKKALIKLPEWNVFYPISEAKVPQKIQLLGERL